MIEIRDKKDCCGCEACVAACPLGCISLREDEQGFLYPVVDKGVCVDCGLCVRVCPVLNRRASLRPLGTLAAKNTDLGTRLGSSSGGVFSLLAEKCIDDGGVVFGVQFDQKWHPVHSWTDSKEGLAAFRGSKYVQSRMGDCYREAKAFLEAGRRVLFSGTPCQISALKHSLGRDYADLLCVDLVCHGVPSPGVWRDYLASVAAPDRVITGIRFRDKSKGWNDFRVVIRGRSGRGREKELVNDNAYLNTFVLGFLRNLYLRPSCYHCPARGGRSGSDITLADFWGIEHCLPEFYDRDGVSLVLVNSEAGEKALSSLAPSCVETVPADFDAAAAHNPCIIADCALPGEYSRFWEAYGKSGIRAVQGFLHRPSRLRRLSGRIRHFLHLIHSWPHLSFQTPD